jgi:TonB-linked SusC/RagA family outer membrane protein
MAKLRPLLIGVLWSALSSSTALAQHPVRGRVTDLDTGQPIAGVQISAARTGVSIVSGPDGRFQLTAPEGALTLNARRVGYRSATLAVEAGEAEVNIGLRATAIELNELVVTGQATSVSRANLANDVTSVSGEDVTRVHSETIESALQGKVPGTTITANSGAPGGGLQIRMRGVTSIFGNSQPLFVVDGVLIANTVIQNGLNAVSQSAGGLASSNQDNGVERIADLVPEDIANIEILKGPSAAAIYGSSAANGVIVITTKHGTPGPTRFSVSQGFGTSELSHEIGERHFTQAGAIAYAAACCGIGPSTATQMYQASGGFQDFEQQVFGDKSLSYHTNMSISGGSERTQYFFNGLSQHDNGIMFGTGYDKQGLRTNITTLVGSKLQVQANVDFVHDLTKRGFTNNDNVGVTPYFIMSFTPSFFSFQPYASAAACATALGAGGCSGRYPLDPFAGPPFTNVIQTLDQFSLPEDVFRYQGSVNATYSILSTPEHTLKATLTTGLDNYSYKANIYAPASLIWQQATGVPGLASDLTQTETQTTVALTLAHSYAPASNALSATTSAGVRSGFDNVRNNNTVTQNLLANQQNVNLGTAVSVFETRQQTRTVALFGQEELLLLNQRLYVSAGVVGQKSTNNADVTKIFAFPKAAASYHWPTLGIFDDVKVRAAFGETGNDPLYGQKFTALLGQTYTGQNSVALQGQLSDPDLRPERERELEGGIEAGLFNSRVSISATVYQKNITDLLLQAALAPSTGYAVHVFNGGELRNRGIEATLLGYPVRNKDVTWSARVSFSRNTGTVVSLPTGVTPGFNPPNFFAFAYGAGRIQVGQPPSQIYGFDTTTGKLHQLGDYEPAFQMGFSSELTYNRFRLFALVDWRHGNAVVNLTQNGYDIAGLAPDSAAAAERLKLFFTGYSPYVQDASFVKLREITLSYQLPDDLVKSVFGGRVSAVRADVSGRNLVTWTPYWGADPEVSNFGNQNINRGQDVTPYPPSRSFFFTLGVDF